MACATVPEVAQVVAISGHPVLSSSWCLSMPVKSTGTTNSTNKPRVTSGSQCFERAGHGSPLVFPLHKLTYSAPSVADFECKWPVGSGYTPCAGRTTVTSAPLAVTITTRVAKSFLQLAPRYASVTLPVEGWPMVFSTRDDDDSNLCESSGVHGFVSA